MRGPSALENARSLARRALACAIARRLLPDERFDLVEHFLIARGNLSLNALRRVGTGQALRVARREACYVRRDFVVCFLAGRDDCDCRSARPRDRRCRRRRFRSSSSRPDVLPPINAETMALPAAVIVMLELRERDRVDAEVSGQEPRRVARIVEPLRELLRTVPSDHLVVRALRVDDVLLQHAGRR